MAEVEIEVIDLEAGERLITRLDDVFPAETRLSRPVLRGGSKEHLGRDDIAVASPSVLLEDFAHDCLGFAESIRFRVVEEVYAGVVCCLHAGFGLLHLKLGVECHPSPTKQEGAGSGRVHKGPTRTDDNK